MTANGKSRNSQPPIIRTEGLEKVYHLGKTRVRALSGIDLEIEPGSYLAIMGTSGSGKSTLLNLLGCLDRPTSGRYLLGGEDVSKMTDDQLSLIRGKRLGFIFQSYNLIDQLTVLENIHVPLLYQGKDLTDCREHCASLARLVGLEGRFDHRPKELSGGQQQRVAIARSLVNDPLMILADEPTGNLDSKTGAEILDLIDALNDQGKTIVLVTHDDDVAGRAHRVLHMKDGTIDRDVRNRPLTRFAAATQTAGLCHAPAQCRERARDAALIKLYDADEFTRESLVHSRETGGL
jgi:putative ABC transport system ATP-binding protein